MPKFWVDHVHIYSDDPVKTAKLYESLFGARIFSTRGEDKAHTTVQMSLQGTGIFIAGREVKPDSALLHFGIRTDDVEKAVADLKKKGIPFERELHVHTATGSKVAFINLPDGITVELLQPSKPRPQ